MLNGLFERKRRRRCALVAIGALGAFGLAGAPAADAADSASAAAPPSAQAQTLAGQLVLALGADPRATVVSDATLSEAWASIRQAVPGAKPEWRPLADQAVKDEMKAFGERLYAGETDLYARRFTETQLADIIAFYRSPSGQAFAREAPEVSRERGALARRAGADMLGHVVAALCGKVACPAPAPPAAH